MQKISVVISAFNESQKIKDCLRSVKAFADEIIVIDNFSSDGTGTIAKSYGAKVFRKPNNLMLNVNKNFGFTKVKNDWILNLDADERVTEELQDEIKTLFSESILDDISGYRIPRKNIIFGKWIEHTGWSPDFQLRLFRKDKGKFSENHVHEQLEVKGEVLELRSPLLHESYSSIKEFLLKFFVIYAPNEAENLIKSTTYQYSTADFLRRPWNEFVKRFYSEKGYLDGVHGFVLSLLMAFYHLVVVCYVWEKKKFVSTNESMDKTLKKELLHIKKEFNYWDYSGKIDSTKNPLHKSFHKIKRKLLTT